jgi:hypothetical protein
MARSDSNEDVHVFKKHKYRRGQSLSDALKSGLAGGIAGMAALLVVGYHRPYFIAGCTAKTSVAPLDRVSSHFVWAVA